MSLIKFTSTNRSIVFCFIDRTNECSSAWTKEIVKNQSDYNINNLRLKGYTILQGYDENILLREASKDYEHAVVFSTGTEFINGESFFKKINEIATTDYFVVGHVLDRKDAYYELHQQCYMVNLSRYKELGSPTVGQQELGSMHQQIAPNRSVDNYHDDYTPVTVTNGNTVTGYNHKCHGWNILSVAFQNNLKVLTWDETARQSKKHFYPENQQEFLKHSSWLYARQNYCSTDFVHTESTDTTTIKLNDIRQVFTPASGTVWVNCISKTEPVTVIIYDYNQKSLDYWQKNLPALPNVSYEFLKIDLLIDIPDLKCFDPNLPTLINLTNIFSYEATAPFYSAEYRLNRENQLLAAMHPSFNINFSVRAVSGFTDIPTVGQDLKPVDIKHINRPSWHYGDWL